MRALLLLIPIVVIMAEDFAEVDRLVLSFAGVVESDRSRVQGLIPTQSDAYAVWRCPPGSPVAAGDPILVWDSSRRQAEVDRRRIDFDNRRYDRRRIELAMKREVQELEEQRDDKLAKLAVKTARLARLRRGQEDRITLLQQEERAAQLRIHQQRLALERVEGLMALGQATEWSLRRQHDSLAQVIAAHRQQVAVLARAQNERQDEQIERLQVEIDELRLEIGVDAAGQELDLGLTKKIAGVRKKVRREGAKADAALAKAEQDLQSIERMAWDHVPLRSLQCTRLDDSGTVVRWQFAPAGQRIDDDWRQDHGSPWDQARGWGWDSDQQQAVHWRKHRGEAFGLVVVRGQASWRCRLPDGDWRISMQLGDRFRWDGLVIRLGTTTLAKARLDAGAELFEANVTVTGGELQVVFGDEHDKAMRAPAAGLATVQPWVEIGQRSFEGGWPFAYFTPVDALRVKAIIHQDLAGLVVVDGAEPPSGDGALIHLRRELATSTLRLHAANGWQGDGTVVGLSQKPVALSRSRTTWWSDNEVDLRELVGREVTVQVAEADMALLHPAQQLRCELVLDLPASVQRIPGHLVRRGANGPEVVIAGQAKPIDALRIGADWVVLAAAMPAGVLQPAPPVDQVRAVSSFNGVVVAVDTTQVRMGDGWGRIATRVADGSDVAKGDVVVSLRNPWLENRESERRAAQVRARQDFLLAVEQRRLQAVEAQIAYERNITSERSARLDFELSRKIDPDRLASARQAVVDAERAHASRQWHAEQLVAGRHRTQEIRRGELALAKAALRLRSARLNLAAVEQSLDWLAGRRSWINWQEAVDRLALRDDALELVRRQETVARQASQQRLRRALAGGHWERLFDQNRHIKATATGRLFYLEGWNDHTRAMTKIDLNFSVWWGMAIAEVVNMDRLALEVEIPERWYGRLATGDAVDVVFDHLGGRRIAGIIAEVAENVTAGSDQAAVEADGVVGMGRVFTIRVTFPTDDQLKNELVPGAKGRVELQR